MKSTSARRFAAIAAPAIVGALVLASCGGSDGAASVSTIDLSEGSTAFVVRPPATTIPDVNVDGAGVIITTEQEYTIQAGDYPLGVAAQFGVSLDDLVAYNEWGSADAAPFFVGNTIKIPPGGTAVAVVSNADGDQAAVVVDGSADGGVEGTVVTIPDAGDNCAAGSYTIEENDIPIRVAEKFDVTVEALNAANATTSGYNAFYVGLEIVIPAKADC